MKSAPLSVVLTIILIILALVVTPIYYIGIMEWARSEYAVMTECRNLVDKVIDSRVLTDDMKEDFELALAAQPNTYSWTIYREVKVVNPDPADPADPAIPGDVGGTYTSYQVVDDDSIYNQGDLITIKVEPVGNNFIRTMSMKMLGFTYSPNSYTFTGRVR